MMGVWQYQYQKEQYLCYIKSTVIRANRYLGQQWEAMAETPTKEEKAKPKRKARDILNDTLEYF